MTDEKNRAPASATVDVSRREPASIEAPDELTALVGDRPVRYVRADLRSASVAPAVVEAAESLLESGLTDDMGGCSVCGAQIGCDDNTCPVRRLRNALDASPAAPGSSNASPPACGKHPDASFGCSHCTLDIARDALAAGIPWETPKCSCRGYADEPACALHGVGKPPSAPDAREGWASSNPQPGDLKCPDCGEPLVCSFHANAVDALCVRNTWQQEALRLRKEATELRERATGSAQSAELTLLRKIASMADEWSHAKASPIGMWTLLQEWRALDASPAAPVSSAAKDDGCTCSRDEQDEWCREHGRISELKIELAELRLQQNEREALRLALIDAAAPCASSTQQTSEVAPTTVDDRNARAPASDGPSSSPRAEAPKSPGPTSRSAPKAGVDADLELLSRFIVDHESDLRGRSDGACKQCYPENTWPGAFVCARHRAREIQASLASADSSSPTQEKK